MAFFLNYVDTVLSEWTTYNIMNLGEQEEETGEIRPGNKSLLLTL